MARKPIDFQYENYSQSQARLELLEALTVCDAPYAWNPADPEAQAHLDAIEQEFMFEDVLGEELAERSALAVVRLEQLWSAVGATDSNLEKLRAALHEQFAAVVPLSWLDQIVASAREQSSTHLSLAERLVQCVTQLLPQWAPEDLQVLARPYAYAMRGESLESTRANQTHREWTDLSEIEKARLSLAIARCALTQLKNLED